MSVEKWSCLVHIKVRHVRRDRVQPSASAGVLIRRRGTYFGSLAPPRDVAWSAVRTLGMVLSNAVLSAVISSLLAFCIDQGNVFSGVASNQQTYAEFLTAKMGWFWAFCWVFTIAECVAKLIPETFTSPPTPSNLSAARIAVKLVRAMLVHIVEVIIFSVGVGFGIASLPIGYRICKADVYWPMMCYNFILTVTDAHTRHIFRVETVNGQARAMRRRQRSKQPKHQVKSARHSPSIDQFCRVFVQNLALVISGLSAGAFVHVTSVIEMRAKWQLVVFAISSQTVKLLIQGVAKYYLSKRSRIPSLRTMAIIVAAPTILVDTQLRTVLLCLDSKTVTLAGSVLLAIAKMALRLSTAMYVRHKTHQIMAQFPPRESHNGDLGQGHCIQSLRLSSVSLSSPELQGLATIQKLKGLHAAEVYADMHGEYIAMCCSYVVIICFGSDPRFLLGGNASSSSTHTIEITTVLVQMGIEVVVDIVAIPLEYCFGVDFESFHKDGAFLTIFMVLVAVVNIHIASGIYLVA